MPHPSVSQAFNALKHIQTSHRVPDYRAKLHIRAILQSCIKYLSTDHQDHFKGHTLLVNNSTMHSQRFAAETAISKVFQSPITAELENFRGGPVGCQKSQLRKDLRTWAKSINGDFIQSQEWRSSIKLPAMLRYSSQISSNSG